MSCLAQRLSFFQISKSAGLWLKTRAQRTSRFVVVLTFVLTVDEGNTTINSNTAAVVYYDPILDP